MEEALTAVLLASAALTGLVGDRVNWNERAQGSALPAVLLQRVSGVRDYTLGAASGLVRSRVQVDCWGADYLGAKRPARAVIAAVSGLTGTFSGIEVQGCFVENERDLSEEAAGGTRLHRVSLDLIIWHSEGA